MRCGPEHADCRVALLGAGGRMGTTLLALIDSQPGLVLSGASVSPSSPLLGDDPPAGALSAFPAGVRPVADPARAVAGADVAIDFTLPAAVPGNVAACVSAGCALVLGVTGLDEAAEDAIAAASRQVAIVAAPNMSLGVNVALGLVALAARGLGEDYQVEILEAHHAAKRDAPSGTALRLGQAVAAERGRRLEDLAAPPRRAGQRPRDAIGFASLRAGDIAGEHTVMFAGPGERLEITHRAASREPFARGALYAARWIAAQPPGLYSMSDVLGLRLSC